MPSEAEWEKAARGVDDQRIFPWDDVFDHARCNVRESGLGDTTPVGIYSEGTSPLGCLDMAGNVWEWTRSLWGPKWEKAEFNYPYSPEDSKREDLVASNRTLRIVRGGCWNDPSNLARCAGRDWFLPDLRLNSLGFRVVLRRSPIP